MEKFASLVLSAALAVLFQPVGTAIQAEQMHIPLQINRKEFRRKAPLWEMILKAKILKTKTAIPATLCSKR